ncbi:MAG TPA: hypothetical protein DCZ68_03225 [Faecalibacterium sp.]|nr:hypothetical protein [Faecalibacterium sp.]
MKIKNAPCGSYRLRPELLPQGAFFTTVYFKAQPYFEPLFALCHKFLQKFVILENLQLFFI